MNGLIVDGGMEIFHIHWNVEYGPFRANIKIYPAFKFNVRWLSMKDTIVCRIENEDGVGPYKTLTPLCERLREDHSPSPLHPNVFRDVIGWAESQICGFSSLESYRKWFKGYFEDLEADGMRLNVYNVPDKYVFYGKYQVTFERKHAKKLSCLSPVIHENIKHLYDLV